MPGSRAEVMRPLHRRRELVEWWPEILPMLPDIPQPVRGREFKDNSCQRIGSVCDPMAIQDVVQLGGAGAQTILIPHIDSDSAVLTEATSVRAIAEQEHESLRGLAGQQ